MNWDLVHKILSGTCTEKEREKFERWLQEDPAHEKFYSSIRQIWNVSPREESRVDVKKAWTRFRFKNMNMTTGSTGKKRPVLELKERRLQDNRKWHEKPAIYAAAAAVFLLISVFLVAQNYLNKSPEITYQEIITTKGEKTQLKLSDGTLVMLNSQSTLKIPSNYGSDDRTIYLKGEAFFEVEHNSLKPFKVYSDSIYAEDLGTRFNVRAFPGEDAIEVVVEEGKVQMGQIQKEEDVLHLFPNERGVITEKGNAGKQYVANISYYIGWTQGKLVFEDTPFGKVVKELERWYNIKCVVRGNDLLKRKLTAEFQNEPLINVLKLIGQSMDIRADLRNRTVIFAPK